ncbi:ras GEF [Lentithecium fluviatile CBS 122367]|uniref:Ras GEF n=1 Tax=Lentithecium fluviatile CBS 122367 TaxID=1168545 RepID=A0A6G1JBR1_9PLEO|nr:ras GEF [Lentithecium fluviatile CBS 122367]
MALPVLQQNGFPGSPALDPSQRDVLAASRRIQHHTKRRAQDEGRRPANVRRQSLRRVKDSKEQLRATRARGASNATIESSTTSTTAGRSFTVANINNGIIYLRPVVRPANQRTRLSPDPFVFPQTPPDSATLDSKALRPTSNEWEQSLYGSRSPIETEFPPPLPAEVRSDDDRKQSRPAHFDSPPRPSPHLRSRSLSTADEQTVTSHSTEPGTFKVVIERQPFGRPKTADVGTSPLLEVPIPNYRLGTPRFSARGTAILRSSVYTSAAGSEDYRSSFLPAQRATHSFLSSRPRSDVYSPVPRNFRTTMDRMPLQPSTQPSSARISQVPIGPQIYDALTTNPDDRAVVRFAATGDILAATPSRLVAHITSPSFLDYELLSDFFLTFRSFLSSRDLVAYLISRLRWAVNRQDDFGRIVRVRTFVALRHWILNYFVDDFVPMHSLRVYFCELVNGLHQDLRAREDGGVGDIKIVGELKKCWRRTCALYWDEENVFSKDSADEDILPGGQVDSQTSVQEYVPAPPTPSTPTRHAGRGAKVDTIGSNPSDQFASRHMDWAQTVRHTPQNSLSTPYIPSQEYSVGQVPISPASEHSMQVLSCSIPMRGLNRTEPANEMPLYPHPVPHPVPTGPARLAASPQQATSVKKSNRPSHGHKRSGSFSDALRDNRAPLSIPKTASTDIAISAISTMPGSLIRGGLFQPSSPYIDVKNGGLRHTRSHLELLVDASGSDVQLRGGNPTNPGMKKLFGSVRRALSSKQPSNSTPHLYGTGHHHHHHHPPSTRSSNPNNSATFSTAPEGVHKRRHGRPRPQVRIDCLALAVAESFKEAVKKQLREEQRGSTIPSLGGFEFDFEKRGRISGSNEEQSKVSDDLDRRLHSGITAGSKSIVIMDDTGAPPLPLMSGALPSLEKEMEVIEGKPKDGDERSESSMDEQFSRKDGPTTQHSDLYRDPEHDPSSNWRVSRPSVQRPLPTQRRSLSAPRERMHSFRRRGSTKTSMARPASLRRHASHNSGLGRAHEAPSMATFQTMSSENDPFFLDRDNSDAAPGPARLLRRRPGGDLRAVDNVHDLEQVQRPHSTGSVSNRTHSIANSVILRSDRYVESNSGAEGQAEDVVDGKESEKKAISLVDTHSSQPNLRPSFEAEVAKLAALPDDVDDDGGIESALMKLEGRYEKKSPDLAKTSPEPSPRATVEPEVYKPTGAPPNVVSSNPSYDPSEQGSSQPRSYAKGDDVFYRPLAPPEAEGQGMYRLSGEAFNGRVPAVNSQVESEDSYSSIPLLDRGLSGITSPERARTMETMRSSAKPAPLKPTSPLVQSEEQPAAFLASPNSSIEYVVKTDSMKRIPKDGTIPTSPPPRESFLLDDDEDLSDMDSAKGAGSDGTSHGVRSFFDDEPAVEDHEKDFLPTHPMRHPPTPPLTANRLNDPLPFVDTTVMDLGLPTPGLTPTSRLNNPSFGLSAHPVEPAIELQELKKDEPKSESAPAHLPFILAYDSEMLAQQFTIVEKDALDEIDWRELIELRWKQSSPQIRDWVQYLRTHEARGVDVVIARFNLVVKWAVSECILTENIEERARCIIKYIHIASHARRLRNYATMYQITIALLSNDVARLKKTWALVPAAEMQTMKDLEALVQPLRNFHNLRVEMETATTEEGCIPFIGIYTRDLIYNSQKPAFIDAPPIDGERLVNFERHHTAATIVKSLLRLLEASSKYTFKPEPNMVGKCLWMAALSDDEIAKRSRQYE